MVTDGPDRSTADRRRFVAATAAGAAALGATLTGATAAETAVPTFRDHLLRCLGGSWPAACPLDARVLSTTPADGYRIERIDYQVEPGDRVPALLLVPDGVDPARPAPAVAVWHQHNGQWHLGKSEPAGLAGDPTQHVGVRLVREGYVVLCPDALCFEERQSPMLKNGDFERFEFLRLTVAGRCMAWKNILDMRRAVDYLCSRPDVRADRIGCFGHSMGSTHTWLVGPWEERLACLVGSCCLPTYAAIERTKILHCFPNFVPGLFPHGDTPDVAALVAPRPLLLTFGETDGGSPIAEVRQGVETIAAAYRSAGAADRFASFIEPGVGHAFTAAMWERTRGWFARFLRES
jgi:dienelactone hydrolase